MGRFRLYGRPGLTCCGSSSPRSPQARSRTGDTGPRWTSSGRTTFCMKSSECRRDVDCQPPAISVLRSASALELLELNIDPTRMKVVVLYIRDLKISILKRLSALFVLTGDVKMTT